MTKKSAPKKDPGKYLPGPFSLLQVLGLLAILGLVLTYVVYRIYLRYN